MTTRHRPADAPIVRRGDPGWPAHCEHAPGPLTPEERQALHAEDQKLRAQARAEAQYQLRIGYPAYYCAGPGYAVAVVHTMDQWDDAVRHPQPDPRPRKLPYGLTPHRPRLRIVALPGDGTYPKPHPNDPRARR